jgi:perosamine synthetase
MFIPVNEPLISKNALKYVSDTINTGWISSGGEYIDKFEQQFADFIGTKHATTCSNGTVALQLALAALDIKTGDEVIVPDLTIISCAFAPMYIGAKPVLVDVDPTTGNLDPNKIETAITPKTKAIMVVHLFGHPAQMDEIMAIAQKHNLKVIEDTAQAHGAKYKGQVTGSIGDVSCYSFYANKIITTGEGGMVCTNSQTIIEKARQIKNLSHTPGKRYFHEQMGYNFRMTNMQAALGLAQLEEIDKFLKIKQQMASQYHQLLNDITDLELPTVKKGVESVYWMYLVKLKPTAKLSRPEVLTQLKAKGVDTRTHFYPLHQQPVLAEQVLNDDALYPVATKLSKSCFYLPSGLAITNQQIEQVSTALHEIFQKS